MPILGDLNHEHRAFDPDATPRGVVAYGITMVTPGFELTKHSHYKAQLLFALRGVVTCDTDSGMYLVPPQRAIWIPGGATHALRGSGTIEGYNAFIDPALASELPARCCTVYVNPLLRELLVRAASFALDYPETGWHANLISLLLSELATAPVEDLHLPMPKDVRLRKLVDLMLKDPKDRGDMASWAKRAGVSERTLARLLTRETGMSFGRFRQQLGIMLALQWMAEGAAIQEVATDLGYESASSFVVMFKKALGTSPGRYMAARSGTSGAANENDATDPQDE
jgi:AraC-like DNA-binding protein